MGEMVYLPLNEMAKFLMDEVKSNLNGMEFVLDEFDISGRKGEHEVRFRLRTVAKVNDQAYVLSTTNEVFYEDCSLTLQLPNKAFEINP